MNGIYFCKLFLESTFTFANWNLNLQLTTTKLFSDFSGFSRITKEEIIKFFCICTYISRCLFACHTLSDIEIFFSSALFDFRCPIIRHQIQPCVKVSSTSE